MNWHERFRQQAGWTRALRTYLFEQADLPHAREVLEVGCGTGAVLQEIEMPAHVHGLDIDLERLVEAHLHAPAASLVCGDALWLPYPASTFDITFCHFLLLWVPDPVKALQEMRRVTRPGGSVLALAEPDYSSRQDEPPGLQPLGKWQAEGLRRMGADPSLGKRLADLFHEAGIPIVECGEMQPAVSSPLAPSDRELEWAVLEEDLAGMLSPSSLQEYKNMDEAAWQAGTRRLHVPTYFACGVV